MKAEDILNKHFSGLYEPDKTEIIKAMDEYADTFKKDVIELALILSSPQITFFLSDPQKARIVEILKKQENG